MTDQQLAELEEELGPKPFREFSDSQADRIDELESKIERLDSCLETVLQDGEE